MKKEELHRQILQLRRHMSQRDIADKLGVTRHAVRAVVERAPIVNFVMNDLHIPFHDPDAVSVAVQACEKANPDIITLNGDIGDFYEINTFPKTGRTNSLANELQQTRQFLRALRGRHPHSHIVYICGNHEYRWDRYIVTNAKALHGLRGLSLREQLDLDELKIEFHYSQQKESSWLWGKLLIGHFDRVCKHSSYTAKNLIEDIGVSLIQGHTHRGGTHYKRIFNKLVVGHENFCLCDLDPGYTQRPNWQQGFSIVYRHGDMFQIEPHIILDGRTFFRGNLITA